MKHRELSGSKALYHAKYAQMIDEEIWAFVDKTNGLLPVDNTRLTIAEQRDCYEALCRAFYRGRPEGVQCTDSVVEASHPVDIRTYQHVAGNVEALVLYVHGGGFILGSLDSHDDVCAEICHRTGFEVISLDYRLAPDFRYPADLEDVNAVFEYVCQYSDLPVLIAGDSAGACLGAALTHQFRNHENSPIGQVFLYPLLYLIDRFAHV